jgi:hypothetical protein
MTRTTIGLAFAAILVALPAFAQTRYQTDRETQMQREEQMRRETTQTQRSMQVPTRANPSVTEENLRDSYRIASEQRENRATKLSAEDYRELARQRRALNEAIRDVERGGNVSASEVDRIIGNDTVY